MKLRKLAAVLVAMAVAATFFTFGTSAAAYEAELLGQMNVDVNADVDEWGWGDDANNTTTFDLGKEAKITIEFDAPAAFTGNWTGIQTTIPVADDDEAEEYEVSLTLYFDGVAASGAPTLINRDNEGFLCIDIARQWGANYDTYGISDREFTTFEAVFTVTAPGGASDDDSATETIVPISDAINTDSGGDKVKDGADTGIADVAVASAIALAAVGAVVITRKRRG